MPEAPFPKLHPYPVKTDEPPQPRFIAPEPYAELAVTSNYTFLTGASHPEELVEAAALLGYRAIALTDTHTLAGVVRAHVAAKDANIQFVLGTRILPQDLPGCSLLLYPTDKASYGRLCRLLTTGKMRAPKGECRLTLDDVRAHNQGLLAILMPSTTGATQVGSGLKQLRPLFDDDRLSLAASVLYGPTDADDIERLAALSDQHRVPLVAINDAHAHVRERRMLQDILTCIRHGCTLDQAGFRLHANAERHLKPPAEMHRLFAACPRALERTVQIAQRAAGFSLDQLNYQYPEEAVPAGKSPQEHLCDLTWQGAKSHYPAGVPEKVREQIGHELELIAKLNYATYFLTVHDLVTFAESKGILCQGRGAAANSAVCYCLGVTAVDPNKGHLLFERFVSEDRKEPPDIDIDFEHERREIVIQYIYDKYGRDRAALTAEVITYRRRSAVRDVGKALGLSLDTVDRLAKNIEWWDREGLNPQALCDMGMNPEEPALQWLVRLSAEILGFPRHLSQHVGGFVITRDPLCELVPLENARMPQRTVIEWDKDDIEAMNMLKVDVLGLGMLTALNRALALLNAERPELPALKINTIPQEDPATYAMIQRADTIGVFQIESRAQMSMLPRLKPKEFYDLVIEVAIVRPGPIQGGMVRPYLERRTNEKPVEYPHPAIKHVLERTLGVPLFQEQCMALAIEAADFEPKEADQLRRAMGSWKRKGHLIERFGQKLIEGMVRNNISRAFAEDCFKQIKGFSEYGFPESHAASFAILVYASAWIKCHYPAHFTAAILNSLPMGFYGPAQLVRCAKDHGVCVRPIDVHHSKWDCTIENGALRLGMRMVSGLNEDDAIAIAEAVQTHGRFKSVERLWRVSGASARGLRRLAAADAFNSMNLPRQQALWQARSLRDDPLPLFEIAREAEPEHAPLPTLAPSRHVALDYSATGLSLSAHPVSFIREHLNQHRVLRCSDLADETKTPNGAPLRVAGLVLVRQRPGTAKDVTFMTIEDETGIANLVIWARVYHRYRSHARDQLLIVHGRIQRAHGVVHVVVDRLQRLRDQLSGLRVASRDFH